MFTLAFQHILRAYLFACLFTSLAADTPIEKYICVYFGEMMDSVKSYMKEVIIPAPQRDQAVEAMMKKAKESQAEVIKIVEQSPEGFAYASFWVVNTLIIYGASSDLILKITDAKGVVSVDLIDVPPPEVGDEDGAGTKEGRKTRTNNAQWNIQQLRVPEVWAMGINGSEVPVATIHREAGGPHPLIRSQYRGGNTASGNNYAYYEPGTSGVTGCVHEHENTHISTHRIGTAVGSQGYGVAPGAKYMACSSRDLVDRFYDCVAWTLRPHSGGTVDAPDKDSSKAPKAVVISNSHDNVPLSSMTDAINMLVSFGITVITEAGFINGNPCRRIGRTCTVPAAICTGFTTKEKKRSRFSACGPGPSNSTKPDIVVPGYDVLGPDSCRRCGEQGDNCLYTDFGVTSGSGHVLGVVALMLQKNPNLRPAQIKKILQDASQPIPDEEFQCCGDRDETDRPNFCSGYGLLDAKAAVDNTPKA